MQTLCFCANELFIINQFNSLSADPFGCSSLEAMLRCHGYIYIYDSLTIIQRFILSCNKSIIIRYKATQELDKR